MPVELAVVSIVFALLAVWRFRDAVTLVLFLLPAYQLRYMFFGVPVTLLEVLLVLLLLVWGVRAFLQRNVLIEDLRAIPWKFPTLLLCIASIIAVVVAADTQSALGYLKAYILEPILFFVLLWSTFRTEQDLRRVYFAFGAMVLVIGAVSLLQYAGIIASPLPWSIETPKRVTSIFEFPNAVGLFVGPILGLFLAFIGSRLASVRWGVFVWLVLGLGFASLVAANSRGAMLAVAAGIVVLLYARWRRRMLLTTLLGVLALCVLLVPATRGVLQSVVTGGDVSADVRLVMWQGTAKLIAAHPLLGSGLGGFPALYDQYRLIKHVELLQYPHNIILNFWVELGLLGLIAMLYLLIAVFRKSAVAWASAQPGFTKTALLGVMITLVIMVVHGIVDVPYFKNDLAVQFWVVVALAAICSTRHERQNQV